MGRGMGGQGMGEPVEPMALFRLGYSPVALGFLLRVSFIPSTTGSCSPSAPAVGRGWQSLVSWHQALGYKGVGRGMGGTHRQRFTCRCSAVSGRGPAPTQLP